MLEDTRTLPDAELYLHQLYVDDNNSIMEELPLGTRLVEIQLFEDNISFKQA